MTFVVPTGKAVPELKLLVTEGVTVQLSVAVGAVHVAMAEVAVVVKMIFVGQADKTGFVTSIAQGSTKGVTVIFNVHLDTFKHLSFVVALKITG